MTSPALSRALDMESIVLGCRDETERQRRLADPIVEELVDSGLLRMSLTEDLGGLALPRAETLAIFEVLARAEASVPWIAWNNSLVCYFTRYMAPSAQTEIFANRESIYAQSTRPCGRAVVEKDGYRVSGRWDLVSGCELAHWLMLFCVEEDDGEVRMMGPGTPFTRFVFVPKGKFEILDTWNSGGLRGSGSHDVLIEDYAVPREHTFSVGDPITIEHALARVPVMCSLGAEFAAQALGIAQSAVDVLIELAKTNVAPGPQPSLRDRPATQFAVAAQTASLAAARTLLHDQVSQMWQMVESGEEATLKKIAAVFGASWHAVGAARTALEQMYGLAGTRALYTDCPLERAHRDFHAMLRHVVAQPMWVEDAGRVQLGLEPAGPLFSI